jgi:hypothetical protein
MMARAFLDVDDWGYDVVLPEMPSDPEWTPERWASYLAEFAVEVDEATLARWIRVMDEFKQIQEEMATAKDQHTDTWVANHPDVRKHFRRV